MAKYAKKGGAELNIPRDHSQPFPFRLLQEFPLQGLLQGWSGWKTRRDHTGWLHFRDFRNDGSELDEPAFEAGTGLFFVTVPQVEDGLGGLAGDAFGEVQMVEIETSRARVAENQ